MCRSRFPCCVAACLFAAGICSVARAEVILGPSQLATDPTPYFRFTGGFPAPPSNTVNNPSFYLSTLNFSGVGWRLPGVAGNLAWNVAMIDNIHFVGAWHVVVTGNMSTGDTVNFRPAGSSTAIVTRTIANLQNVPNPDSSTSDVLLGTLSQPLLPADGVASYPITAAPVIQQVMYVYGRQSEVGQNNVSGTQPNIPFPIDGNPAHDEVLNGLLYDYDQPTTNINPLIGNPDGLPSTVGNNEAHVEAGDSGGPSFVLIGGQLQLIGTHAGQSFYSPAATGVLDQTNFSVDSNLPAYSAQIALMVVPEPGSLALGIMTAAGTIGGYFRSRRRKAGA